MIKDLNSTNILERYRVNKHKSILDNIDSIELLTMKIVESEHRLFYIENPTKVEVLSDEELDCLLNIMRESISDLGSMYYYTEICGKSTVDKFLSIDKEGNINYNNYDYLLDVKKNIENIYGIDLGLCYLDFLICYLGKLGIINLLSISDEDIDNLSIPKEVLTLVGK